MKRKSTSPMLALAAVLGALAWTMSPTPATALDNSAVGTCVAGCTADAKACEDPVREAAIACRDAAGCDDLVSAAQTACEADHDSDECETARAAVRDCFAPCKDAQQTGLAACRTAALTCLHDECGLDGLPPRCGRHGRGE